MIECYTRTPYPSLMYDKSGDEHFNIISVAEGGLYDHSEGNSSSRVDHVHGL